MDFNMLSNDSLAYIICSLQKDFKLRCEETLSPYGLTNGLYFYLIYINKHPACSLNDLTQALQVDKAHTTRTIGRLSEAGFVEKTHRTGDGRTFCLRLTGYGERTLREVQDIFERWDADVRESLTPEIYGSLVDTLYEVKHIKEEPQTP